MHREEWSFKTNYSMGRLNELLGHLGEPHTFARHEKRYMANRSIAKAEVTIEFEKSIIKSKL